MIANGQVDLISIMYSFPVRNESSFVMIMKMKFFYFQHTCRKVSSKNACRSDNIAHILIANSMSDEFSGLNNLLISSGK